MDLTYTTQYEFIKELVKALDKSHQFEIDDCISAVHVDGRDLTCDVCQLIMRGQKL